jgi:hypothetical protein
MDICKMGTDLGTDSETILAECEMIQRQVPDPFILCSLRCKFRLFDLRDSVLIPKAGTKEWRTSFWPFSFSLAALAQSRTTAHLSL